MIAALIASVATVIGVFGATWMRLFTTDPAIQATGALYLHCQAPVFPVFAAGIAAVMACYGVGLVRPPLVVSFVRLAIGVGGGWIALLVSGQALPVFLAVAAGSGAYGTAMMVILRGQFAQTRPAVLNRIPARTRKI